MRTKFFSISILAAAAFLILGLGVANLEASQYLGEVTWDLFRRRHHQGRHQQGRRFLL